MTLRIFLKVTKNMRRVKIEDFFLDIPQFIEKVKLFRSENQFSDPEVFRLKKNSHQILLSQNKVKAVRMVKGYYSFLGLYFFSVLGGVSFTSNGSSKVCLIKY